MIFFLWLVTIAFAVFAIMNPKDAGLATFFWAVTAFASGVILFRFDANVTWTYAFNPTFEHRFAMLCLIAASAMCGLYGLVSSTVHSRLATQLARAETRIKELEYMVLEMPPG
jgi:hypothetical protein